MRCFVAIALPTAVRKHLVRIQEILRREDADVKWVEEENLHLSLKFLGDLDEDAAATLKGTLSIEALRWPGLNLSYEGVGTFPDRGCVQLGAAARRDCLGGAARMDDALVTFS